MSEAEARVAQEGTGQGGPLADAGKAAAQRATQTGEIRGTYVGQLDRLHVAPHLLQGIQLGRVGGQPLHREPGTLATKIRGHGAARVAAQAVPDHHEPAAAEVPLEYTDRALVPFIRALIHTCPGTSQPLLLPPTIPP